MIPRLICVLEPPIDLVKYTDSQDPLLNLIRPGNLSINQLSQGLLCYQSGIHWRIKFEKCSSSGLRTIPLYEDKDSVQWHPVTQWSPFRGCWWEEGSGSGGKAALLPFFQADRTLLPKWTCIKDSKIKKGLQTTLSSIVSAIIKNIFGSVIYFISRAIYLRIRVPLGRTLQAKVLSPWRRVFAAVTLLLSAV